MTTLDLQLWAEMLKNKYGIPFPIDVTEDEEDYDDE